MLRFPCWLALAGLLALGPAASAQTLPVLKAYMPMPVRGSVGRNLSFDRFRVLEMHRSFSITQGGLEADLGGIMATYHSESKNRLRFVVENQQDKQQAEVFALAGLQLRGDVLDNIGGIMRGGNDSVRWKNRNVDAYMGVISLRGRTAEPNWQFTVENSNQIGNTPLSGVVTDRSRQITFSEVTDALAYAENGGMSAALLAAQVQRGFVFSYQGKVIAALDLGDLRNHPQTVFWVKKDLDPTLQLIVASMSTALLARPSFK